VAEGPRLKENNGKVIIKLMTGKALRKHNLHD